VASQSGRGVAAGSVICVGFAAQSGGRELVYTIDKLVCQLREQTGIEFHAHQFRHTYATNLVLDGMNPYHVMTLTRHKSVQSFDGTRRQQTSKRQKRRSTRAAQAQDRTTL